MERDPGARFIASRSVADRAIRDVDRKLQSVQVSSHALALSILGVKPRAEKPRASRYRTCPSCGNPTRGTLLAGDDRCAKCQARGSQ